MVVVSQVGEAGLEAKEALRVSSEAAGKSESMQPPLCASGLALMLLPRAVSPPSTFNKPRELKTVKNGR